MALGHLVTSTAQHLTSLILAVAGGIGVLLTAVPGAALNRTVDGGRTQRAISVALALMLAASVAFIWV
jgi:hypothetical protein